MKRFLTVLLCLISLSSFCDTNVLELIWTQPPNYTSQLYTTTNLSGNWTPLVLASNSPPAFIQATQSVAFFYVTVTPNNHFSGADNPFSIPAMSGSTFVRTNDPVSFWIKTSDNSTNGWVQAI